MAKHSLEPTRSGMAHWPPRGQYHVALVSQWATDPCETQSNTFEINACAKQQYEELDKHLNNTYGKLLNAIPAENDIDITGESPKSLLIKAQRRWVEFRDADCKAKYQIYNGGTIRNAIYLGCIRERTEQRIKELSDSER